MISSGIKIILFFIHSGMLHFFQANLNFLSPYLSNLSFFLDFSCYLSYFNLSRILSNYSNSLGCSLLKSKSLFC